MGYNDGLDKLDDRIKQILKEEKLQAEGKLSGADERRRDREEATQKRSEGGATMVESTQKLSGSDERRRDREEAAELRAKNGQGVEGGSKVNG